MRCRACDTLLNDYEIKLKDRTTGEFLDLCGSCYVESQSALYDALNDTTEEVELGVDVEP